MKKKWSILLVSLLALSAVIGFLTRTGEAEPTYQGLPVRRWIELNGDFATLQVGLAEIGPESIPYLRQALHRRDTPLGHFSVSMWRKLPRSIQTKYSSHTPVEGRNIRGSALWGLRFWGPEAGEALPDLTKMAGTERDPFNRALVMSALMEVGGHSPEVLDLLHQNLRSQDKTTRDQAAAAIFDSNIKDVAAVPLLIESMRRAPTTAYGELLALSVMGPEAEPALPFVIEALKDPSRRGRALTALRAMGAAAAPAVPTLMDLVVRGELEPNPSVIEVFMSVGPPASNSIQILEGVLHDEDGVAQAMAAVALGRIREKIEPAIPVLVAQLRNEKFTKEQLKQVWLPNVHLIGFNHRQTAAWYLGEIGPPATKALPELLDAMDSNETRLRILAARAVWKIAGPHDRIVPLLSQAMASTDPNTCVLAAQALAEMGPAAKPSLPALLNARTTSLYVRRAVNEALLKIHEETAGKAIYRGPRAE